MMTPDSSVPMNHNSVTVSQHAQQQDPDTEAATIYFRYNSFHYLHICFFCCNMSKCLQWKELTDKLGGKGSDMHAGGLIRELETGAQWVWKSGNELEE